MWSLNPTGLQIKLALSGCEVEQIESNQVHFSYYHSAFSLVSPVSAPYHVVRTATEEMVCHRQS